MKENYSGHRITDLWVFVGIDEDGDEGVMAMATPGMGAMPMIASDEKRRAQLEPLAKQAAEMKGATYECRHFVKADHD